MGNESKNEVLYIDWKNKIDEDDKMVVFDKGVVFVFFEKMLNLELNNNTLCLFNFKGKYKNQVGLICDHLNYFIKYYDPEHRYVTSLLKAKTLLDSRVDPLSKESFIKFIYETIITKPILEQVFALVELNNERSIECEVKTAKYGKEASFTDEHNAILYRMAMCTNLIIPLILHYNSRFNKGKRVGMFLIDEYFDPLFEICGKGVNLKEKLFHFIVNETKGSEKRDKTIWEQKILRGETDPLSFAESRLKNIISNIIPKLEYDDRSHNIALIRNTISRDLVNFTKTVYKVFPMELSDERDSDDSLSEQDKMEMTLRRQDMSTIIISNVNKETVIEKLLSKLKMEIDDKEVAYYRKHYKPTDFQLSMIKLYFAKNFTGFGEMSSLNVDQFNKLVVIMKKKMQAEGYKYLQHLILGEMKDKTTTKSLRSMKFIEKIEKSSTYKRLEKKYDKLLKLKGDKLILNMLSVFLKTRFLYVDYGNPKLLGTKINIEDDLVCEEFLMFLSRV